MFKRLCILSFITIIFSTTNCYTQWVVQSSGTNNLLTNACFVNSNTGNVVGLSHKILRTTNGGQNWIDQPNIISSNLWAVYLVNENTGFVAGENSTIAKTTNAGLNWFFLTPSVSTNYFGMLFINLNTGFACGYTGTIIKTTNSGSNWSSINSSTTANLFKIKFSDFNTGYIVGQTGTILKTTDSGDNWSVLNSGVSAFLRSLCTLNSDTLFICGDGGIMLRTTNGGLNWNSTGNIPTGTPLDIYFSNMNTGTVVGLGNIIARTTNGGINWATQINPSNQDIYGLYFLSSDTGFVVGANGTILRTYTGGFSPPPVPNLISPPNGAQNVSITPLLDWDSLSLAETYNLQICLDSTFTSPLFDTLGIVASQCSIRGGLLSNNVQYFWRVRGHNFVGYGPWSNVWKFTTIVSISNPPTLLLPLSGASNVSLHPFFDWDSTYPATYYNLQAHYDSSFTPPLEVDQTGIPLSQLTLTNQTLRNNTRYYWRVSVTNIAGTGPWSNFSNFSTIITIPPAPILLIPINGATNISLTPLLKWVEDVSALHYQLQIDIDSNFVNPIFNQNNLTLSQITIPVGILNNFTKYYWRVQTTNSLGTGPWSNIWNFTTVLSIPASPVLLSPLNGAQNVSLSPILDWDDNPYSTYRLQVSTDSIFNTGNLLINLAPISVSQYQIQGGTLSNNTLYYWRVNATNASGTGPWSLVWHFTTIITAPIAPPQLISPPNGAIGIISTPTLDWNDVFNATGYKVQLSSDSTFTINNILIDSNTVISQLTVPVGRLSSTTKYFWRARGFNIGGNGPWSLTWNFITGLIGIQQISHEIPKVFQLYNNFPNPFNPSTKFRFDIPAKKNGPPQNIYAHLIIYDLLGRLVKIIYEGTIAPGSYEIVWNVNNLASGIYLFRLSTDENVSVKKMVLLK